MQIGFFEDWPYFLFLFLSVSNFGIKIVFFALDVWVHPDNCCVPIRFVRAFEHPLFGTVPKYGVHEHPLFGTGPE